MDLPRTNCWGSWKTTTCWSKKRWVSGKEFAAHERSPFVQFSFLPGLRCQCVHNRSGRLTENARKAEAEYGMRQWGVCPQPPAWSISTGNGCPERPLKWLQITRISATRSILFDYCFHIDLFVFSDAYFWSSHYNINMDSNLQLSLHKILNLY